MAIQMYKENNLWDEAMRIARTYGGLSAYKSLAYTYATSMSGEAAIQMLIKRGLSDKAVDYCLEHGKFEKAFDIAQLHCKEKLNDVHYAYALSLEENMQFEKAETEFIASGKAKEAIEMYIHQKYWDSAVRVCKMHAPDVLCMFYGFLFFCVYFFVFTMCVIKLYAF